MRLFISALVAAATLGVFAASAGASGGPPATCSQTSDTTFVCTTPSGASLTCTATSADTLTCVAQFGTLTVTLTCTKTGPTTYASKLN
jgi:hypothetical protein